MRAKLNWDYSSVQQCATDSDCNYVNYAQGSFAIVDRADTTQQITEFSCDQVVPPLVVANGALVTAAMGELTSAAAAQGQDCAEPADPTDPDFPCDATGTVASMSPPICEADLCQVAN